MKKMTKFLSILVAGTMMAAFLMLTASAADNSGICGLPLAPSSSLDTAVVPNIEDSATDNALMTSDPGICGLPLAPSSSLDALVVPNIEYPAARVGYILVKVNSPCDAQWRSMFPQTWMAEANTAVEIADDKLSDWFGIDFQSVAQNVWTSPDGNYTQILNSAIDNVGLKNGAQIMIAFSGRSPGVGGCAYPNSRHCVVFNQGTANNGYVIRHEVGHLYGCPDEYDTSTMQFSSKECLMNNCYVYHDTLCDDCYPIWDGNKNTK